MNTENRETMHGKRNVRSAKKANRRLRPFYSILLTGMVGLGTGLGGGYLAVKNFSPANESAVYESVQSLPEESAHIVQTVSGVNEGTFQDVVEAASKTVVEIQVENTICHPPTAAYTGMHSNPNSRPKAPDRMAQGRR